MAATRELGAARGGGDGGGEVATASSREAGVKFECVVRFVTPMQDTRKSPLVCRIPTSTTHVVGSCVAGVVRTLEVDVDSYEVLK